MNGLEDFANMDSVLGIGTDLLDATRIKKLYARHEMRLIKRILTESEVAIWEARNRSSNFLAKQFAAKEAISKALGTGFSKGISFQHIEVLRDEKGAPIAHLSSKAHERLRTLNADKVHISLSDEGEFVFAFALICNSGLIKDDV